jgi:hypothetical protein
VIAAPGDEPLAIAGIPQPVDRLLFEQMNVRGEALQAPEREPGLSLPVRLLGELPVVNVLEELLRIGTFTDRFRSESAGPGGGQVEGGLDEVG